MVGVTPENNRTMAVLYALEQDAGQTDISSTFEAPSRRIYSVKSWETGVLRQSIKSPGSFGCH